MLVKPAQAKEKWCPMVRRIDNGIAQNVFGDAIHCIGPDCMMWRWEDVGENGYCGLAGHWRAKP